MPEIINDGTDDDDENCAIDGLDKTEDRNRTTGGVEKLPWPMTDKQSTENKSVLKSTECNVVHDEV